MTYDPTISDRRSKIHWDASDDPWREEEARINYHLTNHNEWCKCEPPTEVYYYRNPVSGHHGWGCGVCLKIQQTG